MHPSVSLSSVTGGRLYSSRSIFYGETKIYLRPSLTGSALPSVLHFSSVLDGVKKALNYESVNGELRQSEIGFWNRLDNDILLGSTRWGLMDWRKWWCNINGDVMDRCNIFFQLFNQLIISLFFVLIRKIISSFLHKFIYLFVVYDFDKMEYK